MYPYLVVNIGSGVSILKVKIYFDFNIIKAQLYFRLVEKESLRELVVRVWVDQHFLGYVHCLLDAIRLRRFVLWQRGTVVFYEDFTFRHFI